MSGDDLATMGKRIRAARMAKGMSQGKLARAIGVEPQTVYRYEKQGMVPGSEAMTALARELGVTERWILHGDEHMERADDAYGAFLNFLETPLGRQLQAGERLGQLGDREILADLRQVRFGGVEPSVDIYQGMALSEIARRRGKAIEPAPEIEITPRPDRARLRTKPKKKR